MSWMSGAMRFTTNDHTNLKDPPEPEADHDGEVVDESDLNLARPCSRNCWVTPWMSGPMLPPITSNSTVPLGSDEIAEPADDEQQEDDKPS
jgi:hypothetical protein